MTSFSVSPCCFEPHDSSLRKPLNLFSGLFLHSLHCVLSGKRKWKHRAAGFLTRRVIFTGNQELSGLTLPTREPTLLHPPLITSSSEEGSGSRSDGLPENASYLAFSASVASMALIPSTMAEYQSMLEQLIPPGGHRGNWINGS